MPWGLGAASLYNAFGDKRTLFTQCLDRYLDANMRARIARVEKAQPPRQAIETFLTEIVERSLENRLGCMLANAALEVAPHDPEHCRGRGGTHGRTGGILSPMRYRRSERWQHIAHHQPS